MVEKENANIIKIKSAVVTYCTSLNIRFFFIEHQIFSNSLISGTALISSTNKSYILTQTSQTPNFLDSFCRSLVGLKTWSTTASVKLIFLFSVWFTRLQRTYNVLPICGTSRLLEDAKKT